MTGYTKLFGSIVASTIWRETKETKIVWITMLALANKEGVVEASLPGLADLARVTVEECQNAIKTLEGPDPYSRTKDNEGRRIKPIEGGWFILNHGKYRAKMNADERREYLRLKQREHRANVNTASTDVNKCQCASTRSTHAEAEADTEASTSPASKPNLDACIDAPKGWPKTEAEAVAVAEMSGVPKEFAAATYNRAVGRGYRDSKGNVIFAFRQFLKAAWSTDQSVKAEQKTNGTNGRTQLWRGKDVRTLTGKDLVEYAKG